MNDKKTEIEQKLANEKEELAKLETTINSLFQIKQQRTSNIIYLTGQLELIDELIKTKDVQSRESE